MDGLRRWPPKHSRFVVVQYGTNDALDYGGRRELVSLATFHSALLSMASSYERLGATVIFISPPPVSDWLRNARLRPYRAEVLRVAIELKAGYVDGESVRGAYSTWTDGVHLTGAAYQRLAQSVAQVLTQDKAGQDIALCLKTPQRD